MKLLVLAGNLPFAGHTVRAATKVLHCLLSELTARGHGVALQVILRGENRREWTDAERAEIDQQRRGGVDVLPALFRSDYQPADRPGLAHRARRVYERVMSPHTYFYPERRLSSRIEAAVRSTGAEAMLIFWSPEGLAAAADVKGVPKLAYYGLPDHIVTGVRLNDPALFGTLPLVQRIRQRLDMEAWEREHVELMRQCDIAGNLCAEHASYYTHKGHPRSIYLQNIWPPAPVAAHTNGGPPPDRLKIIGNVGRPGATGNMYGLRFIGNEIVPRLDAVLGAGGYEMHMIGQGAMPSAIAPALQSPSVVLRGWVDDIDEEIRSSHVFFVGNNAETCLGSHTRFLHAWSLKACCVGHQHNKDANPEMVHGENVLLGGTADEIVGQILAAFRDEALRRRVGEGGWRTYQAHFTAEAVVGRMLEELAPLTTRQETH